MNAVPSSCLNLGIVAHVDAGKTSLTERLLFDAGLLAELGSVDAGTTRTDSLDLERRRGITIRAAVTSFPIDDLLVNLVDTPGHPDFVAEVERSLLVLDAAVLVLSAVEGVQPQTVVLWRALQRLRLPTVLFVNKVDRAGADPSHVVDAVRRRLTPTVVELARCEHPGTRAAAVRPLPLDDEAVVATVAEVDDRVLAGWVAGRPAEPDSVRRALRRGVRTSALTPLVPGSAITGVGVSALRDALVGLVGPPSVVAAGPLVATGAAPAAPAAGTVFAVDRDDRGRRLWLRLWSGELRVRDRVTLGTGRPVPVTELGVSAPGGVQAARVARAGQVAVLRGPSARIGDVLGRPPRRRTSRFPPPTLEALVEPVDPSQRTALFAALAELADEDPLIGLRLDDAEGEAAVRLHGEVQREVLAAMLEERYRVCARFSATSVLCLERVVGSGAAVDRMGERGNPYLAGIGLRVDAAPRGSGVAFSPGVERGHLPPAFVTATEEGVRSALRQGLHGWPVTDCSVTMTESQYAPRQSKPHQRFDKSISSVAGDFRHLAPVVVLAALAAAGTRVCEPVDRVELDLPVAALGPVTAVLGRLGAVVLEAAPADGDGRLVARLPTAAVPRLAAQLPDLTSGEGVLTTRLDDHLPVTGPAPRRPRRGPDPLDRTAWFRDVPR